MSWPIRSLAEVAPIRSRKPEFFDGARRYYSTGAVGKSGELDAPELVTFAERPSRANSMPRIGDVGFARMNGTQKVVLISEAELGSLFSTGFCFLEPNDRLDSKYLFYFLTSGGFQSQKNALAGEGIMGGIKNADVANIHIPLPPLSEQQRIVRLLDEALEGIAMAKANAEKNLQNVRDLIESHLRNTLTKSDEGWTQAKLGSIGPVLMCKRILKNQTNAVSGVPFYKIGTFGKVADAFIPVELFEQYRRKYSYPMPGEVLISAAGTIGKRVIFDGAPSYFQDSNIVWLRNDESIILNKYLYFYYFICDFNPSKGTTINRLYNEDLRNIVISFPKNLTMQRRLVSQIEELQSESERLLGLYNLKLDRILSLGQSLLQQAVSNQLSAA